MAVDDRADDRDKRLRLLKVSIADATIGVASLDMALVMLLADIVHGPPFPRQDLELASVMVFSQTTLERRIDMVRKVINLRIAGLFRAKPHEYSHKVGTFVIKAFNMVAASATKEVWMRNLAAHGNYYMPQEGDPSIIPVPFDFEGVESLNKRRGIKAIGAFPMGDGITAAELAAFAKSLIAPQRQFNDIREILQIIIHDAGGDALEKALVALGKDLQLQAPLRVRPHRTKREKPGNT